MLRPLVLLAVLFASLTLPLSRVAATPAAESLRLSQMIHSVMVAAGVAAPETPLVAYNAGNFKDAYEGYRHLALLPSEHGANVGENLRKAIACLTRLGRWEESDDLLEKVVAAHPNDWHVLAAAATISSAEAGIWQHEGFVVAGKFYRGFRHDGDGRYFNAFERDRTRALQLMQAAMQHSSGEAVKTDLADFYFAFARTLIGGRDGSNSWRLQYLTDVTTLPDYQDSNGYEEDSVQGALVDTAGNPIYPHLPASYDAAKTDGERWRWCLHRAAQIVPARASAAGWAFSSFLREQFDVQTLADGGYGYLFGRAADEKQTSLGVFTVRTLREDETLAQLASGIKRFTLPEEFNFIHVFQALAADPKSGYREQALDMLAQIFEDRQQYDKAAHYWQTSLNEYPGNKTTRQNKRDNLVQIVGNWGQFEPVSTSPAGKAAAVDLRFRNSKSVLFEAYAIRVPKLLADIRTYLTTQHRMLNEDRIRLDDLGYRLVTKNQQEYIGARAAAWTQSLQPRPGHFDRRITITTPLKRAGAYLLRAKMANGNTSSVVLWVADTVIVKKPVSNGALYYVADANTGQPIPAARLTFFGYRQRWLQDRRYHTDVLGSTARTGQDGQITVALHDKDNNYAWLTTASTPAGRLAFLGFSGIWPGRYSYSGGETSPHAFLITDRPVYRPANTVKFKFWLGEGNYESKVDSSLANQPLSVKIQDPRGTKVFEQNYTTDAYGGLDGEFPLASDATLGQYTIILSDRPVPNSSSRSSYGGGSFRVEEYKKPEFDIQIDAPTKPVMLGEKITGTIRANYYFGAPVTHARVKYKVLRTATDGQWYPTGRWDWLFGPGYGWFASDTPWYPGWHEWGIRRPLGAWWGGGQQEQPEVVLQNEAPIGPDGTLKVEFDTSLAKLVHGDTDHRYEITADVTDASRRTITGTGSVMVARKPFQVYAWVDRGYYHTGDAIGANFSAHTLDNKPVEGRGRLVLLKVTYTADGKPVETPVEHWDLPTGADGTSRLQIRAGLPSQYRLSYNVTDAKGQTIEGGYLFTVRGPGFDGKGFRFNDIELAPDKREYQPGDTVRLLINTDHPGSTVALFLRPTNGVYLPPKIIHLTGKSQVETIAVAHTDQPNFFVEGLTVHDAKVFTENREIIVPPESRVITVKALPSAARYKPGEKAKMQIKLTGPDGTPFVGSTVVSLYDKSLDYISGGSNVGDIKTAFWSWKRSHYPSNENSLERPSQNWTLPGETGMADLGMFGALAADVGSPSLSPMSARHHSLAERMPRTGNGDYDTSDTMAETAPTSAGYPGGGSAQQAVGGTEFTQYAKRGDGANFTPLTPNVSDSNGFWGNNLTEPTLRKDFADTAFWAANVTTNFDGVANVAFTMPENLTTWKAHVWSMGQGTRVGEGDAEVVTSKDLIVRLQAPRFFVQKDEVVLSANVHNYLKTRKDVQVGLQLDGACLDPMGDALTPQTVSVPADGETRADFRVKVASPGQAVIRVFAKTDEESDAMQLKFPVYVHGMLKTEAFAGSIRPDGKTGLLNFRVPADRIPAQSRLEIRYSPSVALAMVDALPYLVDYPYGCTEQTLDRFMPTVVTQNVLKEMKVDLAAIKAKRTNLNSQEIGDDAVRAADWKRNNPPNPGVAERNPVFDETEVARMVSAGVAKLAAMQVGDGGWGWFSGYGEQSYPHTTALIVHGLQLARSNGVAVDANMLARGVRWLQNYQRQQLRLLNNAPTQTEPYKTQADNLDAFVYMVLQDAGLHNPEMEEFIYRDRAALAVYGKAMFGLALQKQGKAAKLAMILRNLSQFVVEDKEDETAYLRMPEDNAWWLWYGSAIESDAYYLKLLSAADGKSKLASELARYLINNRKHASYWNSTRDTAICIEALADYIRASGESMPDMTVHILVDGKEAKTVAINAANLFTYDNRLVLDGPAITSGNHTIQVEKEGKGALYFNAYSTNFTLEDSIQHAGLEIKVARKFYKLTPEDATQKTAGARGQPLDQRVEKYSRQELPDLSTLKSGDLVEVELEIDSKNDYEYLLFEDMKPAGFEPLEVRSGYNGNDMGAYMELRDNRVCFFVRELARGKHSVSYRMRAETPGKFSALPTRASALYAPELKANSDEMKMTVED